MNTRDEAIEGIIKFLQSDKKALLMTGTHQYEKHKLILRVLSQFVEIRSKILFRVNSLQNFGFILKNHTTNLKTGEGYKVGKHTMFIDSINKTSWKRTKYAYDFAILYPLDSTLKVWSMESHKQQRRK